jgi:hypothetical protein
MYFYGAQTPFVLRRADANGGNGTSCVRYFLVGECYVHGIMLGEMILGDELGQRFELA